MDKASKPESVSTPFSSFPSPYVDAARLHRERLCKTLDGEANSRMAAVEGAGGGEASGMDNDDDEKSGGGGRSSKDKPACMALDNDVSDNRRATPSVFR